MKKITLLLFLLTISIGYSQSLPIDFSDALDNNFVGVSGSVFSSDVSPTDGGNAVGKIVGGADQWNSRIDLALGTYIDMTTANKTFTFEFYTTEAVVMNGLFQIGNEESAGYAIEMTFATDGAIGWQTITLDFSGATNAYPNAAAAVVYGQYAQVSIFTNFGDTGTSTYYVDDIAGAANGGSIAVEPAPVDAPGVPSIVPGDVISLYSDAYTDVAATWNPAWGQSTVVTDEVIAANNVKKYSNFSFSGIEPTGGTIDASPSTGMTHVNFDYWTSDTSELKLKLVDYRGDGTWGGDNIEVELGIVISATESWETFSLSLSDYTDANGSFALNDLGQFVLSAVGASNSVYIDNLYFSNGSALSVKQYEIVGLNAYPNPTINSWNISAENETINSIEIFNVLGKSVISLRPNSREVTINASNLATGMYFSVISTDGGTSTRKLIKK